MEGNNTPKPETFDAVLLAVAWIRSIMRGDLTLAKTLTHEHNAVAAQKLLVGLGCAATGVLHLVEESIGIPADALLQAQVDTAIAGLIKAGEAE
jgi:hypothetical protein